MVNSSGTINAFAGNYGIGYSGVPGPATAATIGYLGGGIARYGSVEYLTDYYNNVVYAVTACYVNPTITGTTTLPVATTATLADATPSGVWQSGATGVATIGSSSGVVTAVSAGTSIISYTVGSCTATTTVTVSPASSLVWYSSTAGGDASVVTNWWSNNNNTGYQPTVFSTTGTTWTFQSAMTSTAALSFGGNVSIVSGGSFTPLASSTTTVGGNWKNTSGTFTHNSGTVLFTGTNTANTVDTLSGAMTGSNKFNNVTFSSGSVGYTFQGNSADVGGIFSQTAGTVTAPSANLNVGGNFSHTAGNFTPNGGTVTMNGGSSTLTGTGMTVATTNCFNNLSFNASGASTYTIASPLLVSGNFSNLTSSGTIAVGNNTITIGRNWANPGPITGSGNRIILSGSGNYTATGNL